MDKNKVMAEYGLSPLPKDTARMRPDDPSEGEVFFISSFTVFCPFPKE